MHHLRSFPRGQAFEIQTHINHPGLGFLPEVLLVPPQFPFHLQQLARR